MSLAWTAAGAPGVPRAARFTDGSASRVPITSKNAAGATVLTTWRFADGVVVLMPMLVPDLYITEFPSSVGLVNIPM